MESKLSFQIVFEPDSIARSKSGKVTSVFYVLLNGVPFPEITWNDFAEILFQELVSLARELTFSESRKVIMFHFMDGPLRLSFQKINDEIEIIGTHEQGFVPPCFGTCAASGLTDSVSSSYRAFRRALHAYDAKPN
jgi:hypothetical protein